MICTHYVYFSNARLMSSMSWCADEAEAIAWAKDRLALGSWPEAQVYDATHRLVWDSRRTEGRMAA
jgi:hypothetical protein